MKRKDKLKRLRTLQAELDAIRNELAISGPNEVLYLAPFGCCDADVIVVADGFGEATTSVVEGNYPIDFFTRHEKQFASETAALRAAEQVVDQQVSPAAALGSRSSSFNAA